jgi:phosphohistidine phosphatase
VILYFLRHADAGEPRPQNDDDRELTPNGEAMLRAAAPMWRRLTVRPDVVISSPLARAKRTAELAVEGLGLGDPPVADQRLRPGAKWGDLADAMAVHSGAASVMFVGHEPDLSWTIDLLTMATLVGLRKGGLACVTFEDDPLGGAGRLAWLLDPDLYQPDADAVA